MVAICWRPVKPGLYEKLITLGLAEQLKTLGLKSQRDGAGEIAPQALSRHLFGAMIKALRNVPMEERSARQRELANKVVSLLGAEVHRRASTAMMKSRTRSNCSLSFAIQPRRGLAQVRSNVQSYLSDKAIYS